MHRLGKVEGQDCQQLVKLFGLIKGGNFDGTIRQHERYLSGPIAVNIRRHN